MWNHPKVSTKQIFFLLNITLLILSLIVLNGCSIFLRPKIGKLSTTTEVPIYYTENGKGEPVILIHGVLVNSDLNWKLPHISQKLSRHYRVISIDLRGHGYSAKPYGKENYGIKLVKDIADLMNELKIEKAHIIGYSLGGFISLKFATTYPERVYSIVIGGAGWEKNTPENLEKLDRITTALRKDKDCTPLLELVGMKKRGIERVAIWITNKYYRYTNDLECIADLLDSSVELEVSEESLKRCNLPILIIGGTNDPICKNAEELAKVLPNAKLIRIENGTHMSTLFKKEFYQAIKTHLDSNKRRDIL